MFVNAPLDDVVAAARDIGLTMLQLHGDEGPSFCAEAARRTGARVIRAQQVAAAGDMRDLERFHVDFHLLDARSRERPTCAAAPARRSTGSCVRGRRSKVPLILSGGLDAENVAAAIAAVQPVRVDSASGTESAPGHKDHERMAALFAAVREADADAAPRPAPPTAGTAWRD